MQRRDFLCHSTTLCVAGLLTVPDTFTKRPDRPHARSGHKIAIFWPEEGTDHPALAGARRLLRESGRTFEIIPRLTGIDSFDLLILPDVVCLSGAQAAQANTYLSQGGRLLASWRSGLMPEGSAFASGRFGLRLVGEARCSPDFISPGPLLASHPHGEAELPMYMRGMEVETIEAHTLATAYPPALLEAPQPQAGYPAITRHQGVVYFAHPVFTLYARSAPSWCGQLVLDTLAHMLGSQKNASAPSSNLDGIAV